MTKPHSQYWAAHGGRYLQPNVIDTNHQQQPNNARMAIWHFARPISVTKFDRTGDHYLGIDGRFDRGAAEELTAYMVVNSRPNENFKHILTKEPEGERTEAEISIRMDSHQPENIELHGASGFHFENVDAEGRHGHAPIIEWMGDKYKITDVRRVDVGGDDDINPIGGAIYNMTAALYRHESHELEAACEGNVIPEVFL